MKKNRDEHTGHGQYDRRHNDFFAPAISRVEPHKRQSERSHRQKTDYQGRGLGIPRCFGRRSRRGKEFIAVPAFDRLVLDFFSAKGAFLHNIILFLKKRLIQEKRQLMGQLSGERTASQKIQVRFPDGVSFLQEGQTTARAVAVSSSSHFFWSRLGGSSSFISQSFGSSPSNTRHPHVDETLGHVHFARKLDPEPFLHGMKDGLRKLQDLFACRTTVIDKHESLCLVRTRATDRFSLPPALFDEPSRRDLLRSVRL